MEIFNYHNIIREHHLDTFGHVNNATYLSLFEEARWEIINQRNYGITEIQKFKKGPVILEVNVKFRKELHLREKIRIETITIQWNGKIGKMKQIIFNEINEEACTAEFVVGFFDLTERKLIEATPEWLYAIGL